MDNTDSLKEAIQLFKKEFDAASSKDKTSGKHNIKGKDYADVPFRVKIARAVLGKSLDLRSAILHHNDKIVVVQCEMYIDGNHIASGVAEEKREGFINTTSALENCETSAVGRCLSHAGLAADKIAGAEEVSTAIANQNNKLNSILENLKKVKSQNEYNSCLKTNQAVMVTQSQENPPAYEKFLEQFTVVKNNLKKEGVING
jgi:hypothetical protein